MSKETLKKAALTLFSEKGYDGTALSEIAKRAGIKTPSIYAHFESKEELYLTIYREVMQEELANVKAEKREDYETAEEYLKAFFYAATDFERDPEVRRFFQRSVYYPPVSLKEKMQEELTRYETQAFEKIAVLLDEVTHDEEKKTRWIRVFYAFLDGLGVEHELYDLTEFEKRRESAFEALVLLLN
ncbi:TetR/AcrR family transcriptional regulator [Listeria kieliensis]